MKQRLAIIVPVIVILFAIAAYFLFWNERGRDDGNTVGVPAQEAEQESAGLSGAEGAVEEEPGAETAALEASDDAEDDALQEGATAAQAPSFDIIRVEPDGEVVAAGRAPHGSKVTLFDGDSDLEQVLADSGGAWVAIPEERLAPGSHELKLRAELADGSVVWSRESAVVVIPEAEGAASVAVLGDGEGAAGLEETAPGSGGLGAGGRQALVVIVPDDEEAPSRVLQRSLQDDNEGVAEGELVLDTIEYDEEGHAIIAGRAPAGAMVIIYLDNKAIGATRSGDAGRWHSNPEDPVPPGLHQLRVDQLDDEGNVVARVETPFSRAFQTEQLAQIDSIIVQPGNSLWRIARRVYGKGVRYSVIYEANAEQIGDPDLIYPGQIFTLPEASQQ